MSQGRDLHDPGPHQLLRAAGMRGSVVPEGGGDPWAVLNPGQCHPFLLTGAVGSHKTG